MVNIGGWLNTALLGRGGHHRGLTPILTVYPCQNIAASASLQSPPCLVYWWSLVTTASSVTGNTYVAAASAVAAVAGVVAAVLV